MSEFIHAVCPECLTKYRLNPDMVGKRMRCTNFDCQAAFEVVPQAGAEFSSTERVPNESTARTAKPNGEFDWRSAPPPVQAALIDQPTESSANRAPQHREEPKPTATELLFTPEVPRRSPRRIIVAALSLFVVGAIITGGVMIVRTFTEAEERLADDANKAYEAGQFGRASELFGDLSEKHSSGVRTAEYKFKAALARVRHRATLVPPEPEPALAELTKFMDIESRGAFLKGHRVEVYDASLKVFNDFADEGMTLLRAKPPDTSSAEARANFARTALKFVSQNAGSNADVAAARAKLDELTSGITVARARIAARTEILAILGAPHPDLEIARDLIRRAGFDADPEVTGAWQRAEQTLRKLVTYRKLDLAAKGSAPFRWPVLFPDARPAAAVTGARVAALARGVLWALDAKTGRIAWVERLGIDAVIPPRRIRPSDRDSEGWLIIAADPPSLSLRDADTGAVRWYQPLDAMPVGPIEVVGSRGFLALSGLPGRILDFDTSTGKISGQFELGQSLAGGLVSRPGTHLLYVPATSQQVYALDYAPEDGSPPKCIDTLPTNHAAGTLRHPPVIVGDGPNQNLLLATAGGIGDTIIAMHRLDRPTGAPLSAITARLPGWTWFAPRHSSEQITTVTDQGVLGWFALSHTGASDPPLYPLDDRDAVETHSGKPGQRAIVVHADEGSMVVLANGRLTQWRSGIDRAKGRRLVPGWSLDRPLGIPVHEAYLAGPGIVAITTLQDDTSGAIVTAVNIDTGEVAWQRPLGLAPSDQLVQLGTSVAAIDEHGGIWRIDSRNEGGRLPMQVLASPLAGLTTRPLVVVADDGANWVVLSQGNQVVLRMIMADGPGYERKIMLPSPLAGVPAIARGAVVLPLANGSLARANLEGRVTIGPSWRSPGAAADASGIVVPVWGDYYLVSDGEQRLKSLQWSSPREFQFLADKELKLPARPTQIIREANGSFAAVADAEGFVTLIDSSPNKIVGRFGKSGATVSASPIFSEGEMRFVLDGKTIEAVALPIGQRQWRFSNDGPDFIGGSVRIGPNRYIIVNQVGQVAVLTIQSDGVKHAVHSLGAVTPLGTPLHFGGELFVPLFDGTAAVVPVKN